jgi:hypothetical protein
VVTAVRLSFITEITPNSFAVSRKTDWQIQTMHVYSDVFSKSNAIRYPAKPEILSWTKYSAFDYRIGKSYWE